MDLKNEYDRLKSLMNTEDDFGVHEDLLPAQIDETGNREVQVEQLYQYQNDYSRALVEVEKQKILPDLSLNYFMGSNSYDNAKNYHGFEVGVAVPLFFGSHSARIKAAKLSNNAMAAQNSYNSQMLKSRLNELQNERLKYKALLQNFEATGKELQEEMMRASLKSYEAGQIDFFQFINGYESALKIKTDYLNNLFDYNRFTTELMYVSE